MNKEKKDKIKEFFKENWYKVLVIALTIFAVIYLGYSMKHPISTTINVPYTGETPTIAKPVNNTYIPHNPVPTTEASSVEVVTQPIAAAELETEAGGSIIAPTVKSENAELATETATVVDPVTSEVIEIPSEAVVVEVVTQPATKVAYASSEIYADEAEYEPKNSQTNVIGEGIDSVELYNQSVALCNNWLASGMSNDELKSSLLALSSTYPVNGYTYKENWSKGLQVNNFYFDGYGIKDDNWEFTDQLINLGLGNPHSFSYFKVLYDSASDRTTVYYVCADPTHTQLK